MSHRFFELVRALEERSIKFTIHRYRDDTVMLSVSLVGERIEIDVFEDGHVEYSRFTGNEDTLDNRDDLFKIINNH